MSIKLSVEKREITGKKLKALRANGLIPSVVYGGEEPILTASTYNATEKVLDEAGYHSPVELMIDGKTQLAIVKDVDIDPVSRRIVNVSFQAISADEVVEATTPIVIVDFEASEASKKHLVILQVLEEIEIKARPSDLPDKLTVNAAKLASTEDKLTVADIELPAKVEFVDKELDMATVVANVYDPAEEAAAREAAEAAAAEAAETPAEAAAPAEDQKAE